MENQNYSNVPDNNPVMSIGDWIITLILVILPIINIIMLCIWAFGGNTPATKANFAKASLFFVVIGIILSFALSGIITATFSSLTMY